MHIHRHPRTCGLRASSSTSLPRSINSRAAGSATRNRASNNRSLTIASRRPVADNAPRILSAASTSSGYSNASSNCIRNPAIGVRNSCEVVEANCRCCSTASSNRSKL